MLGALAAGLKIGNHNFLGDLPGHVAHAAGGYGVSGFCKGQQGVSCSGAPASLRGSGRSRDSSAMRLRRKGNWISLGFFCFVCFSFISLVLSLVCLFFLVSNLLYREPNSTLFLNLFGGNFFSNPSNHKIAE